MRRTLSYLLVVAWMAAFFVVGELTADPWRVIAYVGVSIGALCLGALIGRTRPTPKAGEPNLAPVIAQIRVARRNNAKALRSARRCIAEIDAVLARHHR